MKLGYWAILSFCAFNVQSVFGQADWEVSIAKPLETFVDGAPIVVKLIIKNSGKEGRQFMFNGNGLPSDFNILVHDKEKVALKSRIPVLNSTQSSPESTKGPPIPQLPKDCYLVAAGSEVEFQCDLSEMYVFPSAGKYTLKTTVGDVVLCKEDLTVFSRVKSKELSYEGEVAYTPNASTLSMGSSSRPLSCQIETGNLGGPGGDGGYILVSAVKTKDEHWDSTIKPSIISVPEGSEIGEYVVDYRWRLWVKAINGKNSSVFVIDLSNGLQRNPVAWTEKDVKVGGTSFRQSPKAKFVIVSIDGEYITSTQSLDE